MASVWLESLRRNFDKALDLLAAAVRDCPDDRWESSMWEVSTDLFGPEPPGPDGQPVTEPAARHALVQRRSTPWSVAWHALDCLDYDLTGEFGPWTPPPPFSDKPHWLMTSLPTAWSRSEMLGYIDYCRRRVRDTLEGLTDDRAARPMPQAHRYAGQPYGWVVMAAMSHVTEHGSQIRQFITYTTPTPARPRPTDHF